MQNSKDYYRILEVSPSSSHAEIKKSYRKLALLYHPDTNSGNQLYEAKFKEIIEAYKVLSDEKQRKEYNRSRDFYAKGDRTNNATKSTPQTILKQASDFRRKVAILDPHRMNTFALSKQIQNLLSGANIQILKHHKDAKLNQRFIEEIIFCSRFLPFPDVERICMQLTEIAGSDNEIYQKIYNLLKEVRMQTTWNKYKIWVAVLLALIFCFAIYFIGTTI